MKERPILFSAPMVRAILDGSKTQTRRVVKGEVVEGGVAEGCPHGTVGDRLWVRETFRLSVPAHDGQTGFAIYKSDFSNPPQGLWKPSIYMPRKASRITLEITDVRVERLKDISESDARAEGVQASNTAEMKDGSPCYSLPYRALWETINGTGSWDLNPWVWAITFKRI